MKLTIATRRRFYREAKKVLGADRIVRLQHTFQKLKSTAQKTRSRVSTWQIKRKPEPWINVTSVHRVDDRSHLIVGHVKSAQGDPNVTIQLHSGTAIDVSAKLHRYSDKKTQRSCGLINAFAILCQTAEIDQPVQISIMGDCDTKWTTSCPIAIASDNALEDIIQLLHVMASCTSNNRELLSAGLGTAIYQRWERRISDADAALTDEPEVIRYNEHCATLKPDTSIIIPVYGRHDFIDHQLAHFAWDEEIKASEIVFVLDDPRLHSAVKDSAANLAEQFDIAFSILYLPKNLGYAGANNAGATAARGENLLLLNSDVLPEAPGWLSKMYKAIDYKTDDYLLGARLLYDDDTIQHNGMRYEQASRFDGLWLNRHPGKGLPRSLFSSDQQAEPRTAVTGACMLVSAKNYRLLGGLETAYILGDFEDSDFCLKAQRAGIKVAIAPAATLYHLERQSQSLVTQSRWKQDLSHYNCWVHSVRWHDDLCTLQEDRAA